MTHDNLPPEPWCWVGAPTPPQGDPMNPLNDFPGVRRFAYYAQFVVAGLILLTGLGLSAAEAAIPTWYVVTSVVSQGLWSYLGLTAGQNVNSRPHPLADDRDFGTDERGHSTLMLAFLVLGIVAFLVFIFSAVDIGVR